MYTLGFASRQEVASFFKVVITHLLTDLEQA